CVAALHGNRTSDDRSARSRRDMGLVLHPSPLFRPDAGVGVQATRRACLVFWPARQSLKPGTGAAMSEYIVTIRWERGDPPFTDNRYSRAHTWIFDGGIEVPASSSPHVVPPPYSQPRAVD